MTDEQQRIAIAEACGWTGFNPDNIPDCIQYTARRSDGKWGLIPDYLNDLNAMNEAENQMELADLKSYCEMLCDWMEADWGRASAPIRAEAFLRTIGKWEEEA
jgi:hypothetical protein